MHHQNLSESTSRQSISFVIPCYKSPDTLIGMISDIDRYFDNDSFSLEIILVCDASPDDTWHRIQEAARRFPSVKGILLGKNYGQHQAILYGMCFTNGDLIVTMDDDGQHRVQSIKEMLKAMNPAVDLVYGNPRKRKHDAHRYFLSVAL
jgi:undecaprenyl-phosphate 4-deoxy-4-formamido-L-arabinose transferase